MEITAAVAREQGRPFSIEQVTLDEPRADEVLVEVAGAGICHTDLVVADGAIGFERPMVLGHEGSGIVRAIGPAVTGVDVGDRVIMSYGSCGRCLRCLRGRPQYCELFLPHNMSGSRVDGSATLHDRGRPLFSHWFAQSSFASHALTYERNLVRVPDDAPPLQLLGPLGCGFQTGAGAVLNTMNPRPGDTLVVNGCGGVGLAAVMAGRIAGCGAVVAVDLHRTRLDAATRVGATHTVDASDQPDLPAAVAALLGGQADFAFDTTGVAARAAVECIGPDGVAVLVGAEMTELVLDGTQLAFGRTVRGTIEGDAVPQEFIPRLLEFHARGLFPFDEFVRSYPLSEINRAVADSRSGATVKPVLIPGA